MEQEAWFTGTTQTLFLVPKQQLMVIMWSSVGLECFQVFIWEKSPAAFNVKDRCFPCFHYLVIYLLIFYF